MRPIILRFDSIDSTNLEGARQAKAGAPEGLCVVAREQTRGRGRLDRSWHSPKDAGLYLSVVLRPQFQMTHWPLISLAAALAVADTLARTCDLTVDVKWPNDICVGGRKLCGILAETVETETGAAAIVGIGVNLRKGAVPPELNGLATSIESETGVEVDHDFLVDQLIKAISERYEVLQSGEGREHTIRDWCAHSSYAFGRRVRVSFRDQMIEGATRGLESDGALRVETDDGMVRIVRAGDVVAARPIN